MGAIAALNMDKAHRRLRSGIESWCRVFASYVVSGRV